VFSFHTAPSIFCRLSGGVRMRSLLRIFSFGLICSLLIASSDAALNVYGYRVGRSVVTAQSSSIVTVNPGAYQTPNPGQWGLAVSSPSNSGHSATESLSGIYDTNGSNSQTKTCLWSAFQNVPGVKTRVTLKFDWSFDGYVSATINDDYGFGSATAGLGIQYSTDGGGSYSYAIPYQEVLSATTFVPSSTSNFLIANGSESINLPNPGSIDITQVRVRDWIYAQTETQFNIPSGNSASASATVTISNIRLEV